MKTLDYEKSEQIIHNSPLCFPFQCHTLKPLNVNTTSSDSEYGLESTNFP